MEILVSNKSTTYYIRHLIVSSRPVWTLNPKIYKSERTIQNGQQRIIWRGASYFHSPSTSLA